MKLHKYFSDGAVIQRDMPFAGKGFAAVGTVTAEYDGETHSALSENGAFFIPCPPHAGSFAPCVVTVRDESGEALSFSARFGDVFLCAGQSNMEYCIEALNDRDETLARCAKAEGIYFINTYGVLSGEKGELVRSADPLDDLRAGNRFPTGRQSSFPPWRRSPRWNSPKGRMPPSGWCAVPWAGCRSAPICRSRLSRGTNSSKAT